MFKAPTVVELVHGVFVGHLLWANQVAAAQCNAVDAGLPSRLVEQALNDVDGLGPTGPAVGPNRCGVGQNRLEKEVDCLDVIHAGLHPGANQHLNGHGRAGGVSPHVGQGVHPQAQYAAISGQRQFGGALNIPAGCGAEKLFAALGNPFNGSLERPGAPSGGSIFGVNAALQAKAAADIAHGDPHLLWRQAQHILAERVFDTGGHLRAHAQHQAAVRRVHQRQHRARFEGQRRQALVGELKAYHMRGAGEGAGAGSQVAVTHLG